jgi:hypothetical protein
MSRTIESFPVQAARYRQRIVVFLVQGALGFALAGICLLLPAPFDKWVGIPGIVLVFTSLLTYFTSPSLRCPSCTQSAEDFDRYCPVCGADGVERNALAGTRCHACQRTFGHYKTRNYRIHFCTHCDAALSREGV